MDAPIPPCKVEWLLQDQKQDHKQDCKADELRTGAHQNRLRRTEHGPEAFFARVLDRLAGGVSMRLFAQDMGAVVIDAAHVGDGPAVVLKRFFASHLTYWWQTT